MSDTYELKITEMHMYSVSVEADNIEDALEKYFDGRHSEIYNEEIVDHQIESVQNLDAKDRLDQFYKDLFK